MVKFIDYLNKCLQNDEFRKYWEAENLTIDENEENIIVDNFEKCGIIAPKPSGLTSA